MSDDAITSKLAAVAAAIAPAWPGDRAPADQARGSHGRAREAPRFAGHMEQGIHNCVDQPRQRRSPQQGRRTDRNSSPAIERLDAMSWGHVRVIGAVMLFFVVLHLAVRAWLQVL